MTAADGPKPEMRIHSKSPSDGDLVLVGSDGLGVRVHTFQLKALFRAMLEVGSAHDTTIDIPDVVGDDLLILRQALDENPKPVLADLPTNSLEMCVKYEMHGVALGLLQATIPPICQPGHYLYCSEARKDYLIWASRLNSVDSAVRLYLSCDSGVGMEDDMPGLAGFSFSLAAMLRPGWGFAFQKAREQALAQHREHEAGYWHQLALHFHLIANSR